MKVSIITATFNSEKYLSECIDSVKNQDHNDIEYIIIDGKSTDGTLRIIQNNSSFVFKWVSETDRGMYDAINKGIKLATGDIIGILNSDDIFASTDVISSIVRCFKNNITDSVYGNLVYVNPENTHKITRFWKGVSFKRYRFRYGWMPAHPTFYVKRSLIEQYGLYENHYYSAADYEFMARYLYKHKVSSFYLNVLMVRMRTGGASNTNLKRRIRANRRDFLAMKKNNIPFSFIVSVLKPLIKIHQYKNLSKKRKESINPSINVKSTVNYLPLEGKTVGSHAELI